MNFVTFVLSCICFILSSCANFYQTDKDQLVIHFGNSSRQVVSNYFAAADIVSYEVFVLSYEAFETSDITIKSIKDFEDATVKCKGVYKTISGNSSALGINLYKEGNFMVYVMGLDKDGIVAAYGCSEKLVELKLNKTENIEIEMELQKYYTLKFYDTDGSTLVKQDKISSIFDSYKLPGMIREPDIPNYYDIFWTLDGERYELEQEFDFYGKPSELIFIYNEIH